MAEPRQTITMSVRGQELAGLDTPLGTTKRSEITPAGALGIANNTGIVEILLNGHAALRLQLREDQVGHAILMVVDATRDERLGVVDVELYDLVPPRRTPAPKRDRRFGTDQGAS